MMCLLSIKLFPWRLSIQGVEPLEELHLYIIVCECLRTYVYRVQSGRLNRNPECSWYIFFIVHTVWREISVGFNFRIFRGSAPIHE